MSFKKWLLNSNLADKTTKEYSSSISGPISKWANDEKLTKKNLLDIKDQTELRRVSNSIRELPIFIQRNTTGHNMYSRALDKYLEYLLETRSTLIQPEDKISKICWNSNNWQKPSGIENKSKDKKTHEQMHGFGHEEWLFDFNKLIDGYHYSFLQPVGKYRDKYIGTLFNLDLYTVQMFSRGKNFWVAHIENVEVIDRSEESRAIEIYKENGWFDEMVENVKDAKGDYTYFKESVNNGILFNIRFKAENVKWYGPELLPFKPGESISHTRYTLLNTQSNPKPSLQKTMLKPSGKTRKNLHAGTRDTREKRAIQCSQLHTEIQNGLARYLVKQYPTGSIDVETGTNLGTSIDLTLKNKNKTTFFEVKTYPSVKLSIRESLGQLLEYSHYPNVNTGNKLILVSQTPLDINDETYLKFLEKHYGLTLGYIQFDSFLSLPLSQFNCDINNL